MEAKEQFSDEVGYNWINQLIAYCASQVTDEQLAGAIAEFPYNSLTKEAYFTDPSLISTILKLVRHKPLEVDSKWQENQDPSGRANEAHVKADTEIAKVGVNI
jgi:asparagine synthase (glutamine-hydrolysing)